jgi:hypothetical protein
LISNTGGLISRMLNTFENDAERNEFIRLFSKLADLD